MLGLHCVCLIVCIMYAYIHIPNMIALLTGIHRTIHIVTGILSRLFGVVLCKTVRSIDDYQRNVVWWKCMYMNVVLCCTYI